MNLGMKIIREILVDVDKCTGCRACEMACSAFHSNPKFSSINPAKARIRVVSNELTDEYVPIFAGNHTKSGCDGRHVYTVDGKTYSECSFCRASCPTRDYFIEPDSRFPLKCDMCESTPALKQPWCVEVCGEHALVYSEREVPREQAAQEPLGQLEIGLQTLMKQHGMEAVIARLKQIVKEK
ncbi:(4Fe-4S)-binding protein [Georgfuchsia toluolica]|uniref:(4Fe-4S)-binding protein n=2 Tax=Georgfuchsia toluolica TaxID=424218 RepID=A0A916J2B9_9PROT|nr:(4Fe-4S)-binding protein [Georgfuchsia toluolica]